MSENFESLLLKNLDKYNPKIHLYQESFFEKSYYFELKKLELELFTVNRFLFFSYSIRYSDSSVHRFETEINRKSIKKIFQKIEKMYKEQLSECKKDRYRFILEKLEG